MLLITQHHTCDPCYGTKKKMTEQQYDLKWWMKRHLMANISPHVCRLCALFVLNCNQHTLFQLERVQLCIFKKRRRDAEGFRKMSQLLNDLRKVWQKMLKLFYLVIWENNRGSFKTNSNASKPPQLGAKCQLTVGGRS